MIRADEYLDSTFHGECRALVSAGPASVLVSTESKKQNKETAARLPCLAKDCVGMIVSFLPFCKSCYLQCISGKMPSIVLRDNLGTATYDLKIQRIVFPPTVPASRVPVPGKKGKARTKGLVAITLPIELATESAPSPTEEPSQIRCLMAGPGD